MRLPSSIQNYVYSQILRANILKYTHCPCSVGAGYTVYHASLALQRSKPKYTFVPSSRAQSDSSISYPVHSLYTHIHNQNHTKYVQHVVTKSKLGYIQETSFHQDLHIHAKQTHIHPLQYQTVSCKGYTFLGHEDVELYQFYQHRYRIPYVQLDGTTLTTQRISLPAHIQASMSRNTPRQVKASVMDYLCTLPITQLHGVGYATCKKLRERQIHTVKDVQDLLHTPAGREKEWEN